MRLWGHSGLALDVCVGSGVIALLTLGLLGPWCDLCCRSGVGLDTPQLTWNAFIAPIFSSYHYTLTLKTTKNFQNQTEIMTLIGICAHLLVLL